MGYEFFQKDHRLLVDLRYLPAQLGPKQLFHPQARTLRYHMNPENTLRHHFHP